jgi:hypothetical protein
MEMSTPINTITFTVTENGITPSTPQSAGIQGDHNATLLVFSLPAALIADGYLYRMEYVDGMGGYGPSDLLTLTNAAVSAPIPRAWTQNGGKGTVRLIVTQLDADGKEQLIIHTKDAHIRFDDCYEGTDALQETFAQGVESMMTDTRAAANRAEAAAVGLETAESNAAASAAVASTKASEASSSAAAGAEQAALAASKATAASASAQTASDKAAETAANTATVEADMLIVKNAATAESARASAEDARTSAESARTAAETARASNETARGTAESARQTAETARQTGYANFNNSTRLKYAARLSGTAAGTPLVTLPDSAANSNFNAVKAVGITAESGTGTKAPDNPFTLSGKTPTKVSVCGKNWFNGQFETGFIDDAGANTTGYTTYKRSVGFTRLYAGKTYIGSRQDSGVGIAYYFYEINGTFISKSSWSSANVPWFDQATFTGFARDVLVRIVLYNTVAANTYTFQLELGTAGTAYSSYTGTDYSISPSAPLYSLPDGTADTYDAVSGAETHILSKLVLTGNESGIGALTNNGYEFYIPLSPIGATDGAAVNCACTHFIPTTRAASWNGTIDNCIVVHKDFIRIRMNSLNGVIADFKAFLAAKYASGTPVTLLYQPVSSTITQHTAQTIPQPYLTAAVTADGAGVSAEYSKDLASALAAGLALKADKAQEAWITPTLVNSWAAYSALTPSVKYRKDQFGRVTLMGAIGGGAAGTTCLTLPTGYRPLQQKLFIGRTGSTANAVFTIETNGLITVVAFSTYASMDGIWFDTV